MGCKYANVLVMDFMTKEIVRCFSIYDDEYDLAVNQDVDQFSHFRRLNYAYLEDDFVLTQKPQDERDGEALLRQRNPDFRKVIQFEPRDKAKCKAQVASIDWSLDGRFVVVCFKVESQVAVWDVLTCRKVVHI